MPRLTSPVLRSFLCPEAKPGCLGSDGGMDKTVQWQAHGKCTVFLIHEELLIPSPLFVFTRTPGVRGQGHYPHFRDEGTETHRQVKRLVHCLTARQHTADIRTQVSWLLVKKLFSITAQPCGLQLSDSD